ncbi:MAG: type III pantothenate kinase [Candidatus Izimaplasma sp.]|nr:type III pantothenate kinase [Candidatus Izimaplasma bacterium]
MTLLIDIGNSNIVVSRYNNDFTDNYRFNTDKTKSKDEYYVLLKDIIKDAKAIIISSVVPELNIVFSSLIERYLNITPLFVGPGVKTGVRIMTDNPKEVGSDIVTSAAAVISNYANDAIIIDLGTATTFTLLEDKIIKGVTITTGLFTARKALLGSASQLSAFAFKKPTNVIGKNTVDSLNSGLLFAQSEAIRGIVKRIKNDSTKDLKVVITGGAARFIMPLLPTDYIFDEYLIFKGLLNIYKKNT